ncbi:FadR/GntR family transcriptional regulator [Ensifer soli]|uniref:FadR/GntR family transcriptional regulator n=1 Tax=Ciceribacter sp. sgz301302 TaxID=3342379 RepID=UPI0035B8A892
MTDDPIDLYARIDQSRNADDVVRQIELLILEGILGDGDRLPGERDLSRRFDVSRPVLREALKELEARGLLVSQHGGGTFVADITGQVLSKPLLALIGRHRKAAADYLEFRRELEGVTAAFAATRATASDRAALTAIIATMRRAHEEGRFEEELDADIALHTAIGECAHNLMLMHTLRSCYRLMREGVIFHRRVIFAAPATGKVLLAQHEALYEAVMAGDAEAARAAARGHIDFIIAAIAEAERSADWDRIAQLRMIQRGQDPARSRPA